MLMIFINNLRHISSVEKVKLSYMKDGKFEKKVQHTVLHSAEKIA